MKKLCFLSLAILIISCKPTRDTGNLPINHYQIIGSHNSYKQAIETDLLSVLSKTDSLTAFKLDYAHIDPVDQLDMGLRSLEFDVFYDPEGGMYSDPLGNTILKSENIEPAPFDTDRKLKLPGLKMFHVQDIDFRSHFLLFKDALMAVRCWSDSNPDHFPVIITVEPKDSYIKWPDFTRPLPFNAEALKTIDEEIISILGKDRLITPDLIRGRKASLEEAVLKNGWPSLDRVKGKFMFVMDAGGEKQSSYLSLSNGLQDRVMFVNAREGEPEAAFRIINDPVKDKDYIADLVKKGYMVRTRADAETVPARTNDYTRFSAAKESGAQVISTDYYQPDLRFSDYKVVFEGNRYQRLNPVK